MKETVKLPLAGRDIYTVKQLLIEFVDYWCYGTNSKRMMIIKPDYIKGLSDYIISNKDAQLFKSTFGSFNYGKLQEVNEGIRATLRSICESGGDMDLLERLVFDKAIIGTILNEKEILEEAGFTVSDNSKKASEVKSKRGSKEGNFRNFIKGAYKQQSDNLISAIREEIEGRRPKGMAKVLIACMENGYIIKPECAAFIREFDVKFNAGAFKKYLNKDQSPDLWEDEEVKEIQERLKSKIEKSVIKYKKIP